jgi:putative addiction module CopG family antidote
MAIRLSSERERFVRSLVQGGWYASEEAVVDEALRLLEARDRNRAEQMQRLEALLIEGLNSGPSTPMTSEDWDEIEREGQRIAAARQGREAR